VKICKTILLMTLLLSFQNISFANEGKICKSLENCTKGSIIQITGFEAQKYCDFSQAIIPVMRYFISKDDLAQGASYHVQCVYRGGERTVETPMN